MTSPIRMGDILTLLRDLGFDCDRVSDGARVCKHAPSGSVILLTDRPEDVALREQTVFGVRLQLDNGGVLRPEEFDLWAARTRTAHAKAVAARPAEAASGSATA